MIYAHKFTVSPGPFATDVAKKIAENLNAAGLEVAIGYDTASNANLPPALREAAEAIARTFVAPVTSSPAAAPSAQVIPLFSELTRPAPELAHAPAQPNPFLELERDRLAFDRERVVLDRNELDRRIIESGEDRERLAFDRERLAFDRERLAFDRERLAFDAARTPALPWHRPAGLDETRRTHDNGAHASQEDSRP